MRRMRRVHDSRAEHDDIPDCQRVLSTAGTEYRIALDDVNAYRPIGIVGRYVAGGRDRQQRQAQRAFLHQRARRAPVFGEERGVDGLFIARQVMNENVAFQRAVE